MKRINVLLAALTTFLFAGLFSLPVNGADATTQPSAGRTVDQIMADYKAAALAPPDTKKFQSDKDYQKDYIAQYRTSMEAQAKFAHELLANYPDDPNTAKVMSHAWMMEAMRSPEKTLAEMDAYIGSSKDADGVKSTRYLRTIVALRTTKDPKAQLAAIEQFIAAAPDQKTQAASLLMQYAESLKDKTEAAAIQQRVIAQYPDSDAAKQVAAEKRVADAEGKPFDLTFTDAIGGKKISMADLKGKVVVVDFWATWCGPCVAEMPHMKELYSKFKDQGVEFVGVSLDQPEDKGGLKALKDFVAKNEIGWPQYYQGNFWQSEFSQSWGINSIPCMFVVDAKGNLVTTKGRGQLEKLIPELIEKRDGKQG